mgnify:FL=1
MNEQAIIDSYILFKKDGYLKSFQEFKQLIATNSDALNYSYELFKKDGYTKSLNDYKILMGVTSQSLEPNPNPAPTTNVSSFLLIITPYLKNVSYQDDQPYAENLQ